jgi:hypothetical protein
LQRNRVSEKSGSYDCSITSGIWTEQAVFRRSGLIAF